MLPIFLVFYIIYIRGIYSKLTRKNIRSFLVQSFSYLNYLYFGEFRGVNILSPALPVALDHVFHIFFMRSKPKMVNPDAPLVVTQMKYGEISRNWSFLKLIRKPVSLPVFGWCPELTIPTLEFPSRPFKATILRDLFHFRPKSFYQCHGFNCQGELL